MTGQEGKDVTASPRVAGAQAGALYNQESSLGSFALWDHTKEKVPVRLMLKWSCLGCKD